MPALARSELGEEEEKVEKGLYIYGTWKAEAAAVDEHGGVAASADNTLDFLLLLSLSKKEAQHS